MDLADVLMPASDGPRMLQYGVVTQASPLLVRVGAATTGVAARRLASYTPTLSDFVAVLVSGADRLVLGAVTT
jgi:hypothetical protein